MAAMELRYRVRQRQRQRSLSTLTGDPALDLSSAVAGREWNGSVQGKHSQLEREATLCAVGIANHPRTWLGQWGRNLAEDVV